MNDEFPLSQKQRRFSFPFLFLSFSFPFPFLFLSLSLSLFSSLPPPPRGIEKKPELFPSLIRISSFSSSFLLARDTIFQFEKKSNFSVLRWTFVYNRNRLMPFQSFLKAISRAQPPISSKLGIDERCGVQHVVVFFF